MKKKLLPALLVLVMVLGMFPLAAFAAGTAPDGVAVTPNGSWDTVDDVNVFTAEGNLSLAQSGTDGVQGNNQYQFGYYPKISVTPGDNNYVILSRGQNENGLKDESLNALLAEAVQANSFPYSKGTDSLANWFQVYSTEGQNGWTNINSDYWPNSANAPVTNIVLAKGTETSGTTTYTYTKYKFDFSACTIEMPFTVAGADGTVLTKAVANVQQNITATNSTTLAEKKITVRGACKWVDAWTEAGFPQETHNYVALTFTPNDNVQKIEVKMTGEETWKTLDSDNTLLWQFNAQHNNTTVDLKVTFGDQTHTGATVSYKLDLSGVTAATDPAPGPGGEEITATLHTTWQAGWTEGGDAVHRDQDNELNLSSAVILTQEQVTALEGQLVEYIAVSNFPAEANKIVWTYQRGTGAEDSQTATIDELTTDHRCGTLGDVTVIKLGVSFAEKNSDDVWTLKAGDFVQSIEFFKDAESLGKVEDLTLRISNITIEAAGKVEVEAEADATTTTDTADDGTVIASSSLDKTTLDEAIVAAKNNEEGDAVLTSVTINATTPAGTTAATTTLTLNKDVVEALVNDETSEAIGVAITTDVGTVALNADAVAKIQEQYTSGTEATTITVTKKAEEDVTPPTGVDADSNLIGYEIVVNANGTEISGSTGWGSDVEITLTFEAPEGVTAETTLTVYVGDTEAGTATYDAGNIIVTVPHLTPITVVYSNEEEVPAVVDIEYTQFADPEAHLAAGYFTIKDVDDGTQVTAGSYLVQLKHSGIVSLFVVTTDSTELKFLCNCVKGDQLGVWKLEDAAFDTIKDTDVSSLTGSCLVFQALNADGFFVSE